MAAANINHVLQHGTFHEVLAVLSRSQGEANFPSVASAVLMAAFNRGKEAARIEFLSHFPPQGPDEGRFLQQGSKLMAATTEKPKYNFEQLRALRLLLANISLARCHDRGLNRQEIECLKLRLFDSRWLESIDD